MANRVIHFDLSATNPEEVAKFYTNVFGWEIELMEMPEMSDEEMEKMKEMMGGKMPEDTRYWQIKTGSDSEPGINGGLSSRMTEVGEIKAWVNTIGIENLEETMQKIKDEGGEIVRGRMPIPDVGWYALAKDTDGNFFGILQEDKTVKM